MKRHQMMAFWGLALMITYLYTYEIVNAIRWVPTPGAFDHANEARSISSGLFWFTGAVNHMLWILSIPMVGLSQRLLPSEGYLSELVYIPFLNAFQWLAYGCLFGWWRHNKAIKKTLLKHKS